MKRAIRCGIASAILLGFVGNGLAGPPVLVVDARTTWMWFQSQYPSRHLAMFPDGTIVAETWNNVTFPLLDPNSGAVSLFPGQASFQNGAIGVAPNPIVWSDPGGANLVGGWGSPSVYRQDGSFVWRWDNDFGCCNNLGLPYIAADLSGRRLLASLGNGLYVLPIGGPPAISSVGGQASGFISATSSSAYVAGTTQYVSKWDISGATPVLEWSRQMSGPVAAWNFSEGAIAGDGTFVVTRSGSHASPYWSGADIWRAGELYAVSSNGQSTWAADALATTPPVIGPAGLIYVGGLTSAGAPQSQLDTPGIVRAFNRTGVQVWSTATPGLPQDLFVGDDGNVYVMTGGTTEGHILALDQGSGAPVLDIQQVPSPWEMLLKDGIVYAAGDAGIAAIPLPSGFAYNYDARSPWPVRQQNNQRSSQQLTSDDDSQFAQLGSNTFTSNQTVKGTVTATAFVGDGSALSKVTASGVACSGCIGNQQLGINYAGGASQGGPATSALLATNASNLGGLPPSAFQPAGSYATTGANTFSGTQTIGGNLTLNGQLLLRAVSNIAGTPSGSQALNVQGWDGLNPTIFQWLVNSAGKLNLQTATGTSPLTDSGLTIASNGTISFPPGQTFPGTQNALSGGAGISITGNSVTNTGVLSVASGNNGIGVGGTLAHPTISNLGVLSVTAAAGSAITVAGPSASPTLSFTPDPSSLYNMSIAGNAATATSAANALKLGGVSPTVAAIGTTVAVRDVNGDLFGNSFRGTGAVLTGDQSVGGNLSVARNVTVNGNQTVTGSSALSGTVTIGGGTPIVGHVSLYPVTAAFSQTVSGSKVCLVTPPMQMQSNNLTVTDGDTLILTPTNATMAQSGEILVYSAWVSATNTFKIRVCSADPNIILKVTNPPFNGTFRIDVWKH